MAIPIFGGMLIEATSLVVVPVLYAAMKEMKLKTEVLLPDGKA